MNATATHTTRWAQYLAQAQALTPPASTGPRGAPRRPPPKRLACSATATS